MAAWRRQMQKEAVKMDDFVPLLGIVGALAVGVVSPGGHAAAMLNQATAEPVLLPAA
jgi:hypothetical protein